MVRRSIRGSLCIAALVLVPAFHSFASGFAQGATAPAGEVVPAAECMVTPHPLPSVRQLIGTPAPGQEPGRPIPLPPELPIGEAADTATAQEVAATIRETVACTNAGDALRLLALYSDAYLGGLGPFPKENFAELPTPSALPTEEQVSLVDVRDVQVLTDGRVRAVVVTDAKDNPAPGTTAIVLLARTGDRWVIDAVLGEVAVDGTPVSVEELMGTPSP